MYYCIIKKRPAKAVKIKLIIKENFHQYLTLSEASGSPWPETQLRYLVLIPQERTCIECQKRNTAFNECEKQFIEKKKI